MPDKTLPLPNGYYSRHDHAAERLKNAIFASLYWIVGVACLAACCVVAFTSGDRIGLVVFAGFSLALLLGAVHFGLKAARHHRQIKAIDRTRQGPS